MTNSGPFWDRKVHKNRYEVIFVVSENSTRRTEVFQTFLNFKAETIFSNSVIVESYLDNSYGSNACKFFALLTINPKAKVNESKTHVYVNQLQ